MDMFSLKGKTAMVTGGSRGLGLGMAEGLCEAGARVVVLAASDKALAAAEALRAAGHEAMGWQIDLADRRKLGHGFDKALELLDGRLDILLNSAGVQRRGPSEAFDAEDWDAVLRVNLTATFEMCQLAGRVMLARGGGKIINVASMLTFFGGLTVPAYAASKGGVAQLTKALANEWASRGINVNAVAPGYMATDMNTALMNDAGRNTEILARIPVRRWGTPQDMKGVAVFLASAASDYMNGAVIPVDGGYLGR